MTPARLLAALALLAAPAHAAEPFADAPAVRAVLDAQVAAWNAGDVDGFMVGYWKSDDLTFVSGGGVTRGWEATRQRYLRRYGASRESMGTLRFEELQVEGFGPGAASVLGAFRLTRGGKTDAGRFTLLLRKFPDGWRVVHDHTSADEPAQPKPE